MSISNTLHKSLHRIMPYRAMLQIHFSFAFFMPFDIFIFFCPTGIEVENYHKMNSEMLIVGMSQGASDNDLHSAFKHGIDDIFYFLSFIVYSFVYFHLQYVCLYVLILHESTYTQQLHEFDAFTKKKLLAITLSIRLFTEFFSILTFHNKWIIKNCTLSRYAFFPNETSRNRNALHDFKQKKEFFFFTWGCRRFSRHRYYLLYLCVICVFIPFKEKNFLV